MLTIFIVVNSTPVPPPAPKGAGSDHDVEQSEHSGHDNRDVEEKTADHKSGRP